MVGLRLGLQGQLCGPPKGTKPNFGHLVRCIQNGSRGPFIKGRKFSEGMVAKRVVRPAYKSVGTKGSKGGSIKICTEGGYYSIAFGQQGGMRLHKETGGHKKQRIVSGGLRVVGKNLTNEYLYLTWTFLVDRTFILTQSFDS